MLFNSYTFILCFLPVALALYWLLDRTDCRRAAKAWLVLASLFFYGWWNTRYLPLILSSIAANFLLGVALGKTHGRARSATLHRFLLIGGLAANLLTLGYFKYTHFIVDNWNVLTGGHLHIGAIVLPLGISFFTFQQMAYLVDAARGLVREYNFIDYALFVSFFPQLIAGPIVHHADVLPQFERRRNRSHAATHVAVGVSIFAMGLFKKVVLADGVARFASPVFGTAAAGHDLTLFEAWGGVAAYSLQLYFDFSGYSDMAIGLARLFGIRLPQNFNSPYRASSIIEFWQRWHITLSQFLRDYLYIPLGGNRRGPARRYVNLLITMLLGGLWHGAGWTFVLWGALHGVYLVVNHAWRHLRSADAGKGPPTFWARPLTLLCVMVGWVLFRSADLPTASRMLRGMIGAAGVSVPADWAPWLSALPVSFEGAFPAGAFAPAGLAWIAVTGALALWAPNVVQIHARAAPVVQVRSLARAPAWLRWRMDTRWALLAAGLILVSFLRMSQISEFLYFQF